MSIFEDKQRILEDIRDKRTPNRALSKIEKLKAKSTAFDEVVAEAKWLRDILRAGNKTNLKSRDGGYFESFTAEERKAQIDIVNRLIETMEEKLKEAEEELDV